MKKIKKREELNEENIDLKKEINDLKNDKESLLRKISEYDTKKRMEYQNEIDNEKERMEKELKEELKRIKLEQENIMKDFQLQQKK